VIRCRRSKAAKVMMHCGSFIRQLAHKGCIRSSFLSALSGAKASRSEGCAVITQTRSIFSDEFLGLVSFGNWRQYGRLRESNSGNQFMDEFRGRLQSPEEPVSVASIFTEDILKFLRCAQTDEDLQLLGDLLKKCMADEEGRNIPTESIHSLLVNFFKACVQQDNLAEAVSMWKDPNFAERALSTKQTCCRLLLVLMYRKQKYPEIAEELMAAIDGFEGGDGGGLAFDCVTLAMAALAQQNPSASNSDSLVIADKLMKYAKRHGSRCHVLYQYIAYSAGELALAHDRIREMPRGAKKFYALQLELTILAELGRVEDCLDHIRQYVLFKSDRPLMNRVMGLDVLEKIGAAVKAKSDDQLTHEFDRILHEMAEKHVALDTTSIKDKILQEIRLPPKRSEPSSSSFRQQQRDHPDQRRREPPRRNPDRRFQDFAD